jgi:hypothetical protein
LRQLEVQEVRIRIDVILPSDLPTNQVVQLVTRLMNVTKDETGQQPSGEWQRVKRFKRGPDVLRLNSSPESQSKTE